MKSRLIAGLVGALGMQLMVGASVARAIAAPVVSPPYVLSTFAQSENHGPRQSGRDGVYSVEYRQNERAGNSEVPEVRGDSGVERIARLQAFDKLRRLGLVDPASEAERLRAIVKGYRPCSRRQ